MFVYKCVSRDYTTQIKVQQSQLKMSYLSQLKKYMDVCVTIVYFGIRSPKWNQHARIMTQKT